MRIKIACANNIFFDISNANFTIQALSLATIAAGAAPTEPSTNGCFIVTLSQPAPTGGMTVTYSVATGGSAATPGVDYVALSGSVVVPAGASTANIPVVVLDDSIDDPGETMGIMLTAGPSYIIGSPSSATLTIGNIYRLHAVDRRIALHKPLGLSLSGFPRWESSVATAARVCRLRVLRPLPAIVPRRRDHRRPRTYRYPRASDNCTPP